MKLLSKARTLGIVAVLAGGGTLLAQPAPEPTAPPSDTGATASAGVDLKLSIGEMITRSVDLDKQVKLDLRHVRHLQEVSRKEKDIIKLTCVNDKLLAMKAQANIFDSARHDLEALSESTGGERQTVYPSVVVAADSVRKLRGEADACVGENELSTSESQASVNDPGLPDPWTGNPFTEGVEPPAYASPFN